MGNTIFVNIAQGQTHSGAPTFLDTVTLEDNVLDLTAPAGEDLTIRMGDSAGANKISYTDLAGVEQAYLNSDGVWSVPSILVGGVALKTTADIDWYISPAGNDTTGTGTLANPWLTRQKAYNLIPDVIAHKIVIHLAAGTYYDAGVLTGRFITTGGSITIQGAITQQLGVTAATGGSQINASGYGQIITAGGLGVNTYQNYWIRFQTSTSPSAIIYEKYAKIISHDDTTITTAPIRFTPSAATTFDIVSFDTTISGATSGAPNTVNHVPEKTSNMQTATDVWYDGVYALKQLTYDALIIKNGALYSFYDSQVNALITGVQFDVTDPAASANAWHAYLFSAGSYLNLAGVYQTGYSNALCYIQEGSVSNIQNVYLDYTAGAATTSVAIQASSGGSVYLKDYVIKGDATHVITSMAYISGSGAYGYINKGRVDWATNILQSLQNGFIESGTTNTIYGANNTNLYNLTGVGAGKIRLQTNAGVSNNYFVDDSSMLFLFGSNDNNYAVKDMIKSQTGIVAASTIPIGFARQSLTAAAPTTLTSTPTIAAGVYNGQEMHLIGTSDVNTVTLQDSATLAGTTLELINNNTVTLGLGDKLDLIWNTSTSKWEESLNTFINMLFKGPTGTKGIYLNDNQADALSFLEATNRYLSFVTTNGTESVDLLKNVRLTQPAFNAATPTALTITGAAHTSITGATEDIGINLNFSANKTWAAGVGPLANQREIYIQAPTYIGNAGGALTIADAYTFYVNGGPTAGANLSITRSWAAGFLGNVAFADGTVALPGLGFGLDPNTGFYRIGNDNLGLTLNGVKTWDYAATVTSYTQAVATTGSPAILTLTGAQHTTLTNANLTEINFNLTRTIQFAGAGGATNIANYIGQNIGAPTITNAGAGLLTIADAFGQFINAPLAGAGGGGTNITRPWAIGSNGDICFTLAAGTSRLSSAPVAGVARTIQYDIPIIAGGAGAAALNHQIQIDGVAEAGLYAETDGGGGYRGAVWKVPYASADYGAAWAGVVTPNPVGLANGSMIVLHNTNGAGADRVYIYTNGVWKSSGDLI